MDGKTEEYARKTSNTKVATTTAKRSMYITPVLFNATQYLFDPYNSNPYLHILRRKVGSISTNQLMLPLWLFPRPNNLSLPLLLLLRLHL